MGGGSKTGPFAIAQSITDGSELERCQHCEYCCITVIGGSGDGSDTGSVTKWRNQTSTVGIGARLIRGIKRRATIVAIVKCTTT